MESKNKIPCPKCNAITCVLGKLDSNDSDYIFRGHFSPLYMKIKVFWTLSGTAVDLEPEQKFYACYSCGHLWGQVDRHELLKVLEKCDWKGEEQIPPRPSKPIIEWFLYSVMAGLIAWIVFLKLNT